jgi:hypothetical protein
VFVGTTVNSSEVNDPDAVGRDIKTTAWVGTSRLPSGLAEDSPIRLRDREKQGTKELR